MSYGAGGPQRLCYKDMFTCACKYITHVQKREEGKRTKSAEGVSNSLWCYEDVEGAACFGCSECGAKVS